ncbi:sucrase ferredoxin [Streptomyces sp. SID14478]|uniref:sucrase ferredoxin n=1 Tax=Streptomyces sp. SID14478 TaxID=2706073 RepID=UPI0013DA122C|nr:sucrase ferredoxin [Streptomyces sp. SID14478]NEB75570.1 sucrase ferredoxin [Streptomyces sp. SID14478]
MNAAPRFFCADAARLRGDSLAGTAPYGSTWILIEYRGGWPADGFDGLPLEPVTKGLVYAAAAAIRARMLLVRRHGRRSRQGPPRWAVLRHGADGDYRQTWGEWSRDEDLAGIVGALGSPGEAGRPPVVLVCAHGLHDACCAVRGRPVGRALSERWPDLVWECTHVGGDRFAANVVIAPDGVYYGNLDAASAVSVVEEHLADRVHADHLRGYTDLFPPQQAAVAAALARFGPAGRRHYAVEETLRLDDRWRVRLTGRGVPSPVHEIEVRSHRAPPHQLTCKGRSVSSSVVYEVLSVSTG